MRIEATPDSLDVVMTRDGFRDAAVSTVSLALVTAIGGWRTAFGLVLLVALVTLPIAWWGRRAHPSPPSSRPITAALGGG